MSAHDLGFNRMPTPWGPSQDTWQLAPGIYAVSTASHGGILIGRKVARARLSLAAQAAGEPWGAWLAFEEDCDWAIPALEIPEVADSGWYSGTPVELREYARGCVYRWNPEYAQARGWPIAPEGLETDYDRGP